MHHPNTVQKCTTQQTQLEACTASAGCWQAGRWKFIQQSGMLGCSSEWPDLHSLGGLASTADSTQIEASVSSIAQLQLQVGALTHDLNFHGVQAIDLEWDLFSIQASFTGREHDADILACSRS